MRIHTDLPEAEVYKMLDGMPGVYFEVMERHGSRSRANGFEVQLRGNSNRRPNYGTSRTADRTADDKAATWDEWGIFLNRVFEADPTATTFYYESPDDFHFQTAERFMTLKFEDQHKSHKWDYSGEPRTFVCKCGAIRRWRY